MNLFIFVLYKFQKLFISIILKIYSYKIALKEEKLQELHNEINYQTENYRTLLYSARAWANEYNKILPIVKHKKHQKKIT